MRKRQKNFKTEESIMAMNRDKKSIWASVDWVTILLYIALMTFGWISICGASYTYGETNLFTFDSRSGK